MKKYFNLSLIATLVFSILSIGAYAFPTTLGFFRNYLFPYLVLFLLIPLTIVLMILTIVRDNKDEKSLFIKYKPLILFIGAILFIELMRNIRSLYF